MSKKEIRKAVDKWLGRFILLKYLGFVVLVASIGLTVAFSMLWLFALMPLCQYGILIGLAMIIIGVLGERILAL